jgi:Heparinase II/III-like protein/Bacterial Ig-like domain (group 2)
MKINTKALLFFVLSVVSVFLSGISTQADTSTPPILTIDGQIISADVGDIIDLNDKFFGYVSETDKEDLEWTINDNDSIYFVEDRFLIYALKAGSVDVTVKNPDQTLMTQFTVKVEKVNHYEDGDLENLAVGSHWAKMNQNIENWVLYTGYSEVKADQIVKVEEVMRDGVSSRVTHASHGEVSYSTLYRYIPLEPGDYYVELDIKGENLTNNVYARINQGKATATQTTPVKGTFDWQRFTSTTVTVDADDPRLKLELYGANFSGDVWFDNIGIYKVISSEYLSFNLNTNLISIEASEQFQVEPQVVPGNSIDFVFDYEIIDETIATVDKNGLVTAQQEGYTKLIVTDQQYGIRKEVYVIVGKEASFTTDDIELTMMENTQKEYTFDFDESSHPLLVFPYTDSIYGKYYIKNDNTIVYSPNENFNSAQKHAGSGQAIDQFQVILYDAETGYQIVNVEVLVQEENSPVIPVDYWLSTPKNETLLNGYLEFKSVDIETEIPETKEVDLKIDNKLTRKQAGYHEIQMFLSDGTLSGTSQNGGQVDILHNGNGQLIKDRYYTSTGKITFGSMFSYTPKEGFIGYDYIDVKIVNGDKTTEYTITIYVLPALVDFKFDETDFSGVYLLTSEEWIEETRTAYQNGDPYITKWVKNYEDRFKVFNPTGAIANARGPLEQLAILYQVTGNKRYADLAWQQLHEMTKDNTGEGGDGTKRASWGQDSNGFLDAAMATYSVSVAYNYIQDTLNDAQKLQVIKALYEEGFYWFESLNNPNVLLHGNNHGLLIGGNMAVAALGVMSYAEEVTVNVEGNEFIIDIQEMASEVVTYAYEILQIGFVHYSPSGGYPEGPGYSYYAHRSIVGLLATMRNVYGTDENGKIYDFGLSDVEGIANYPAYTLYSSTPNYDAFYYNEGSYSNNQPGLLWYARVDEKYIPYTLLNKIADTLESYNIMNLLWYKPGSFDDLDISTLRPLDQLLEVHEIASFRNSFGDPYGIFTALKGFDPESNVFSHKSLDSGTFEVVAFGEKFIENFSDEDYHTSVPPGYWDYDYARWTYYKKQAQGHNTIVFNPSENPIMQQDAYAKAPINQFESNSDGGFAVIDLSDVYAKDATFYQRGLMLSENRSVITLQDEFTLRKTSELYWAAHTKANIEIINDKLAVLTLNGKKLYAQINSEVGSFSVMPGEALPGTVGKFHNTKNDGVNKLVIHLEGVTEGTLNVTFTPSLADIKTLNAYEVTNLTNWEVTESDNPDLRVDDITFNAQTGNQYKYEFSPTQYSYLVKLASNEQRVPQLNVTYDQDKYDVEVINATRFADLSLVKVTDQVTKQVKTYTYRFVTDVFVDGYDEFTKWEVKQVTGDSDEVANLIDNDRNTKWVGTGRNEIVFEFEEIKKITNVSIRFSGGAIYQYYFDIYAGNSLDEMDMVYFAGQSNYEIGDEFYTLGDVEAKYVKLVFKGNTETGETQVSRVNFYQNLVNYDKVVEEDTTTTSDNPWIMMGGIAGGVLIIGALAFYVIHRRREV